MDIPEQVIDASVGRADCGGHLELRCKYKGEEVYSYVYDEDEEIPIIGFPEFYIWDGKVCRVVNGDDGVRLLLELLKESLL